MVDPIHGDHDHDHDDHGSEISPMDVRVRALETVLTFGASIAAMRFVRMRAVKQLVSGG